MRQARHPALAPPPNRTGRLRRRRPRRPGICRERTSRSGQNRLRDLQHLHADPAACWMRPAAGLDRSSPNAPRDAGLDAKLRQPPDRRTAHSHSIIRAQPIYLIYNHKKYFREKNTVRGSGKKLRFGNFRINRPPFATCILRDISSSIRQTLRLSNPIHAPRGDNKNTVERPKCNALHRAKSSAIRTPIRRQHRPVI